MMFIRFTRTIEVFLYTLNYQHLRYFWTVFRHGNLTRASTELRLTPQTVSTQIHDLEDGFKEKLFIRQGRRLVLTDIGQVVFRYADEIFCLGKELQDVVRGQPVDKPIQLSIGVSDVVPKIIAHHLIEPALKMKESIHVTCREGNLETLLTDLAVHNLDVVLSDSPIPPTVKVKAYNHLLGKCSVKFMGSNKLARKLRKGFPQSLNGAPFLVPVKGTVLRQKLDDWFIARSIYPKIVGEFEDSALLKVFGQSGIGFFAIPTAIEADIIKQYDVRPIGVVEEITECFYAISIERRITNPAITAISKSSRTKLFK